MLMKTNSIAGAGEAFATLRRLARAPEVEPCDFCSVALPREHRHLFEPATQKIICACDPCALRFENVVGRWKLIPRDVRLIPGFHLSDTDWDSLALPIELAFIFRSTAAGRVLAMYPSPAGATESSLPAGSWENLLGANRSLIGLAPDVEALLINRLGSRVAAVPASEGRGQYFIAPIDVCFELVGLIRVHWRGLSGGDQVWREIEHFFARLAEQAQGTPAAEGVDA